MSHTWCLHFCVPFPPPSPSSRNVVSLPHAFTEEVAFTAKKKGKKGKEDSSLRSWSQTNAAADIFSLLLLPSLRPPAVMIAAAAVKKRRRRRGLLLITFSPPPPSLRPLFLHTSSARLLFCAQWREASESRRFFCLLLFACTGFELLLVPVRFWKVSMDLTLLYIVL